MSQPRLTRLRASDYRRTPWKNGLGHTDQIAIHPPAADLRRGDYLWRVSTASVAQSAPFSVFPNHDRVLVIITGAGVRLSHEFVPGEEREVVELPPMEPYEFPGDVPTQCDLQDGPIQDFSVFLRKGEVSVLPEVAAIASDEPYLWEPQSRTAFVFSADGEVEVNGIALAVGETLRLDFEGGPSDEPLAIRSLAPESRALLIQIDAG